MKCKLFSIVLILALSLCFSFIPQCNVIAAEHDNDKIWTTRKTVDGIEYSLTVDLTEWDESASRDGLKVFEDMFFEVYPQMYDRFGFYSSNKNDKYSGYLFLDYGKVDNELKRHLTNLGLSTNVEYKGKLFELGGEYKLNLNSQKNKAWKVNPYVNVLYSKYDQGGYTEKDGGIFNHIVESKTKNYADGQLGLEFAFSSETENYILRLAGKRAFSGEAPELTYSFEGDMANKYSLDNEQDKNHLLVSFKGERKISTNTFLSADFSMQRGSHDRDMKASLSFWRRF